MKWSYINNVNFHKFWGCNCIVAESNYSEEEALKILTDIKSGISQLAS